MGTFTVNIAGCLPCCGGGACELIIPNLLLTGSDTPVANVTEAQLLLTSRTKDCLVAFEESPPTNAFFSGADLLIDDVVPYSSANHIILFAANYTNGSGVTLGYTDFDDASIMASVTLHLELYDEAGAGPLSSDSVVLVPLAPDGSLAVSVPADGCYLVRIVAQPGTLLTPGIVQMSYDLASANVWTIGSIFAAYDDGGGVQYEPCV